MDGRITPTLIKEAPSAVKVLKIVFICFTPPEVHVSDLEVAPKVAGRVAVGFRIMGRPSLAICHPLFGIVRMDMLRMSRKKFLGFWPERLYALRRVIEIDGETIGLVVILHIPEYVIIHITKEVNLGFDAPIVLDIFECRVLVKHPGIPAAHLMIGHHRTVLNIMLLQYARRFIKEVTVDP